MRRVLNTLAGLTLVLGSLIGTSHPAQAHPSGAEVRCGAVITTNLTLRSSLLDCPSNGLVIGADDITLDLDGHTLDGDGVSVAQCLDRTCDLGVDNTLGYDGVTIKGGSVTGFDFGVSVAGASGLRLSRLRATRNHLSGVILSDVTGGRVERSTITQNGLTTDFAGMDVFRSSEVVIDRNDISDSGDIGLFIVDGSSRNTVRDNRIAGNPEDGILVNGDENLITGNLLTGDGGGVAVGGNRNRVTRNVVLDVLPCGEDCGRGLQVEEGAGNVITRNIVRRASVGISIEAYGPLTTDTVVAGNLVASTTRDGISVDVVQPGGQVLTTQVRRNLVRRAGDDGIDVGRGSATLTGNRTFHNDDLGIEAAAGVTDGGGNRAAGNGNPIQCTTIRCA